MKQFLIVLIALILAGSACSTKDKPEKLAPELAADAMNAFNDERYEKAIETFNKLRDWYPFDRLTTLAEYKIAEAHFKMEAYDEAVISYEEFEKLHPRNEAIPYVLYQIAMCHYLQIDTIDRDQNTAKKAVKAFRRLQKQFPDTEYAQKADERVLRCLKSIAGHEIYVGKFYFKSKRYKSALARFKHVKTDFPDLGFDAEATEYIAKCNEKIASEDKTRRSDDLIILPE